MMVIGDGLEFGVHDSAGSCQWRKEGVVVLDTILLHGQDKLQWRQLPKEFGPWMTVYRAIGAHKAWDRVLMVLRPV